MLHTAILTARWNGAIWCWIRWWKPARSPRSRADQAKAEPIRLAPPDTDASEAPYFVDLVHDQIVQRLGESDVAHSALRIYTSLDPELQRAAAAAVEVGMKNVDELVRHRYYVHHHNKGQKIQQGLSIRTGMSPILRSPWSPSILTLVRFLRWSVDGTMVTRSLDHAVSERPTGSIFKPFVLCCCLSTRRSMALTSAPVAYSRRLTKLDDDPQDFMFNGKPYTPGNFERGEYPGMVTATDAIAHSLNIATISLAQMVGYDNVAALARSAGIVNARGTPSVAIGTYNATPLDMAGAYTVFANNGVHLKPWVLASVRNAQGDIVADFAPEAKQILDPRTAFLTQSLLENVMAFGTAQPFAATALLLPPPARPAPLTMPGSRDIPRTCFASSGSGTTITPNVNLQGADAAAPIWAEFMNRAIRIPQYSDMKPLGPVPNGVEVLRVDRATDLVADDSCPSDSFSAAFLVGTAPESTCSHMGESSQSLGSRIFGFLTGRQDAPPNPSNISNQPGEAQPPEATKHRNLLQKIFGTGKDKSKDQQPQ